MAFIPVADTVLVEVRMQLDSQKIENTLYFHRTGGFTIGQATSLGNALLLWWTNFYAVPVSLQLTLREIFITDLSSATGFTVTIPAPAPAPAGNVNFESEPNAVAIAVSFRTGLRGRSFRGRNYVSGLPGDAVLQNTVQATPLANLAAAYEQLFTVAAAEGVDWAVVSRFSGVDVDKKPIPRAAGVVTLISAVLIVDPTVDSQRRRAPGRGQ